MSNEDLNFNYRPIMPATGVCMPNGVAIYILEDYFDICAFKAKCGNAFVYANASGPEVKDEGFVCFNEDDGVLLADAHGRNVAYSEKATKQLYKALKAYYKGKRNAD